ncbi:right-handed parallel beta-helix repeat-containing protein [Marmoricola sp. RAF53]|uniref:right-handed parallel beta-helix repeat-containing protein n=1 Tax=Marmoricola sp. RAF53 TaxID=3233059 RepID=UPI003F997822
MPLRLSSALLVVAVATAAALAGAFPAGAPAHADTLVAACTNSTADATTIRSQIAASAVGDTVLIRGRCLVNQTIVLSGGRTYAGEGVPADTQTSGATLVQAPGTSMPALLASDSWDLDATWGGERITVRNLALEGNGNAATSGLLIRSWATTVRDMQIKGFGRDAIQLSNPGKNGTALGSTLVGGRIVDNFLENSGRSAVWVEEPSANKITDWQLMDNIVATTGDDAFHLADAAGWMVERNHLYGIGKNAIWANRTFATSINDNYVEDFGRAATDATTYYGIWASLAGDSGTVISDNRIFNSGITSATPGYVFLAVTGNYGNGTASVQGNLLRGPASTVSTNLTGLSYTKGTGTAVSVMSGTNVVDRMSSGKAKVAPDVTALTGY